jgi:hypothetical protein
LLANQDISASPKAPRYPHLRTHSSIIYPKLSFTPHFLFATGSPIAAVLVQRGQSFADYKLSKTKYFNIFNLCDPIAYRIEPLVDKRYAEISPILLKRPSSQESVDSFSYYKEMMYSYLPDISLSNVNMTWPAFPFSTPSFSNPFPNLNTETSTFPLFGNSPLLRNAQEQIRNMLNSVWGHYDEDVDKEVGSKRKRHHEDGPARKKVELEDSDGNIASEPVSISSSPRSQTLRAFKSFTTVSSRPIKRAFSKLGKSQKQQTAEVDSSKERTMNYISTFFSYFRPSPSSPKRKRSSSPDLMNKDIETNMQHLGEELTKELVAAANEAEKSIEADKDGFASEEERHTRFDYFVQEKAIDNMIQQYVQAFSAHFSYWNDKVKSVSTLTFN